MNYPAYFHRIPSCAIVVTALLFGMPLCLPAQEQDGSGACALFSWIAHNQAGSIALCTFVFGMIAGAIVTLWIRAFIRMRRGPRCITMSAASKMVHHRGQWMSIEEYLSSVMGVHISHAMTQEDREEALRTFRNDVAENGIPRPSEDGAGHTQAE